MDLFMAENQQYFILGQSRYVDKIAIVGEPVIPLRPLHGASSQASCYHLVTLANLVLLMVEIRPISSSTSACLSPCVFSVSVDPYTFMLSMRSFKIAELPSKGKVKLVIIYYLFNMLLDFFCKSIRKVHLF